MVHPVRHQLFLSRDIAAKLADMAKRKGVARSEILVRALTVELGREQEAELDARFGARFDRISSQIDALGHDLHVEAEALALLIRYLVTVLAPLADDDLAGRAAGTVRFEAMLSQIARRVLSGIRTFDPGREP